MNRSIHRQIFSIAAPNALSNITIPLLGMADIAIAGHAGGDSMIGAVAVGTSIFNFIYMNCIFLRMGTTGLTAQAYGAGDMTESKKILFRATTVAIVLAMVIILLRKPLTSASVFIMGGSDNLMHLTSEYVMMRFLALPASLPLFAFNGWFVGMQDAKTPLFISIFTNIVNIGASYWLTLGQGLGISGIALGTVIAQYTSLILALVVYQVKYSKICSRIALRDSLDSNSLKKFLCINRDVFLRSFSVTLAYTIFTRVSANISDEILAIDTLLMQLFTLYSYLFDGVGYAAEALSGKYIGMRDHDGFRTSVKALMIWAICVSTFFILLFAVMGNQIMTIFEPSGNIALAASKYLIYITIIPIAGFAPYLFDGILLGATHVKPLRNTVFIATIVFIISLAIMVPSWGNDGLWISFVIFTSMRGILLIPTMKAIYENGIK